MPAGRADRVALALRTIGLALVAVLAVIRLDQAAHFLASGVAAIRYPFELDFGEGVVLNQTKVLMAGQSIYHPIDRLPYTMGVYPPVFHFVTGAVDLLVKNGLAAGRGVSLACTLLTAVIIAVLVWQAARTGVGRLAPALAAAVGGLSFLSLSYTASWGALMRVDMLANLLAFSGLLRFVTQAPHRTRVYWSALPFLLALYTKQSTVAAPAACLVVAMLVNPALALRLAALLAAVGLGSFTLVNALTGGQFYFHLVTAHAVPYSWHRTAAFLSDLLVRYPFELAIALVATRSLLRELWPQLGGWPWNHQPLSTARFNWPRPVLGAYLLTAFLLSLTVGKSGSDVNYLIEFMGVVCACSAVALADVFARSTESGRSGHHPLGQSVAAVVLPALLLWPASGLARRPGIEWVEIPSLQEQHALEQLVEMMRRADGPVLSQDLTLLILAGKPVEYQPCDLPHMAYLGRWDQSAFIERIAHRQYALIVLGFDANTSEDLNGFTPQMIAAIRGRYSLTSTLAKHWVYAPR